MSFFLYLAVQDAYYYWAHRLMHHPKLFRWMHAGHHRSRQPTPFASFAFDPAEAALTGWLLPGMVFIIPIHIALLIALLLFMSLVAIFDHSGWEILPRWLVRGPVGGQLISATHHSYHHIRFDRNYGLYFRFWDKMMGTEPCRKTWRGAGSGCGLDRPKTGSNRVGSPIGRRTNPVWVDRRELGVARRPLLLPIVERLLAQGVLAGQLAGDPNIPGKEHLVVAERAAPDRRHDLFRAVPALSIDIPVRLATAVRRRAVTLVCTEFRSIDPGRESKRCDGD